MASKLSDFDLGYEFLDDADLQRYRDFERRSAQERRNLLKWVQLQFLIMWLFCTPRRRRA